ncbi:MAG: Acb2/Tad1 domain-containing protein [Planctomycetota bacterium]|jgi:hypothetical protein
MKDYYSQIEHTFCQHIVNNAQGMRMDSVREILGSAARLIAKRVPEGRELSLALTKLEEAMFWADAGIARNAPEGEFNKE